MEALVIRKYRIVLVLVLEFTIYDALQETSHASLINGAWHCDCLVYTL